MFQPSPYVNEPLAVNTSKNEITVPVAEMFFLGRVSLLDTGQ